MATQVSVPPLNTLEQARIQDLESLIAGLQNFSFEAERSEFSRLFDRAQRVLEIDDLELARMLRVSRPTIGRWARGESAPHPLGRKPVFVMLAKVAQAKLRVHETHHEAVGASR
jgi:transcriptional regulator with XRE-family HTH domain